MKKAFVVLALLGLASFGMYKYIYKDHKNIKKEKAQFVVDATTLLKEYQTDFFKADQKYLDKVLIVKGVVTELGASYLTLNEGVTVYFTDKMKFLEGSELHIKGRLVGYDELLEQIKIDNASVVK